MKAKNQLPPLHIAAVAGMSDQCEFVLSKTPKETLEVNIEILENNGKDVVPSKLKVVQHFT